MAKVLADLRGRAQHEGFTGLDSVQRRSHQAGFTDDARLLPSRRLDSQLVRAATNFAHDLRVIAAGRRLRRHRVDSHGRLELADHTRTPTCGNDHFEDRHAGVPTANPGDHDDEVKAW